MNALTTARLLILTFFLSGVARAAEFRFQCVGEVTGLCDYVWDADGKQTTIKISPNSDPEARAIFLALQKKRIYGTKGKENHKGAIWEQGIVLVGDFTSGVKRTPSGLAMAPPEDYREFHMTDIKLLFPVSRFEVAVGGNEIDGPMIIETHFSFASLFPEGLKLDGKTIDLDKHVAKSFASR